MSDLTQFRDYCRQMSKVRGVQSQADRELFARLADEVDAYLVHDPEVVLFAMPGDEDVPLLELSSSQPEDRP